MQVVEVETVMKACKTVETLKQKAKAERELGASGPTDEKTLEKLLEVFTTLQ